MAVNPFKNIRGLYRCVCVCDCRSCHGTTVVVHARLDALYCWHIRSLSAHSHPMCFPIASSFVRSEAVALEYFHDRDLNRIPHVFRVSQKAYKSLVLSHKHQCIVISGESGAGKTETAKFLVGHLLSMCKGEGTLEQKIVQVNISSNPTRATSYVASNNRKPPAHDLCLLSIVIVFLSCISSHVSKCIDHDGTSLVRCSGEPAARGIWQRTHCHQ